MALKTTLENLDGLSEELHELYEETDDGFVLKVSGIDDHPDVVRLKRAYEAEKAKRKEASDRLKELPDDFDPDQWEKVKSGKAKESDLIELRKQLEGEANTWKTKAQELEGRLHRETVQRQLDEALASSGITNPTYQKAARALLSDGIELKDGKAVVDTDMGPMELGEHVKRWVSSEGQAFIAPAKGGGAGGGKSTEKKATLDQFRAMGDKARVELHQSDPEHFKELSSQLR